MIRSRTALALALAAMSLVAIAGPTFAAPTFIEKQQAGEWLAHRLVGTKVLNAQAEEVGEVKEIVIDAKGQTTAVVIGVGGFLGIPEKLIAVPFASVQIGDVVHSSRVVVVNTTTDELKAAPAYTSTDPGTAERVSQKASDWYTAAKAKVLELTKAATDKAKEMSAPKDQAPAPKQ